MSPMYYFQSGQVQSNKGLNSKTYKRLLEYQKSTPVVVMKGKVKTSTWWMFQDEFYWDDKGYSVEEIKATALVQQLELQPFNQYVEMLLITWKIQEYNRQANELTKQFDELHLRMTKLLRQGAYAKLRGVNDTTPENEVYFLNVPTHFRKETVFRCRGSRQVYPKLMIHGKS